MSNITILDDISSVQDEINNIWQNINRAPSDHVSYWITTSSFIFAVLGSISNLMTVIVLSRLSTQLATFVYLTGLSLSDMITCLAITITHMIEFFIQSFRSTSIIIFLRYVDITCGALAAASRVLSLWISTAVTMDRWILICYPVYGKTFCTLKRARIITRTLFIIACIYSIPLFFEYDVIQMPSVYQLLHLDNQSLPLLDGKIQTSMIVTKGYSDLAKRRLYRWAYMFFNAIFVYTIPTITIVCFNIHLILTLRRVKARSKQLKSKTPSNSSQSKYSITMMVIIMVLTLLICRSPTYVIWILWSFELTIKIFFDQSSSSGIRRFHNIANLIAIINAATNFIPFCVFGQLFRAECFNIYCCCKSTNEQVPHQIKKNFEEDNQKITIINTQRQPIAVINTHSSNNNETKLTSNVVKSDNSIIPERQYSKIPTVKTPLLTETVNL